MPLFESASNLQFGGGGNFVDIAGDLNLNVSRLTIQDRAADPLDSSLEFAFSDGGTSRRRLMGVEGNGAARMLSSGEALPNVPPFPYPYQHRGPSTPSIFQPVGIPGPERLAPVPRRLESGNPDMFRGSSADGHSLLDSAPMSGPGRIPLSGYQVPDVFPGSTASGYLSPDHAVMPGSSHIPLSYHNRSSTSQYSEPPLTSSQTPRIRVVAPTPRTPPIENNRLPLYNYLPTDLEHLPSPVGGTHRPFPADFRGELALANGPPRGSLPYGSKTNINVNGNMNNNIHHQGESGFHILHRAIAGDAFHDAAERYPQPRCHPETRTEMLEDLYKWSNFGSNILWLHGPAGAGKSAIAQSFCQCLAAEGRLGASFFFKRGHNSRGLGTKLFPTIAYQLALHLPDFKWVISDIVADDPSIIGRSLGTQLQRLITEPCKLNIWTRTLVIVIDGLDECEGEHLQQEILFSLGRAIYESGLPFRFMIASRPEPHIQGIFQSALSKIHCPLNINQSFEAVQTYLVNEFRRIHQDHWQTMATVDEPWPSYNLIKELADKSSGYFIYAATVVRFIDDRDFRPTERLDMIMGIRTAAQSEAPFAPLDGLYIQILSAVPSSKHAQLLDILAVIAAKFNLSGHHIEQLLELQPGDAHLILRHLHSVLNIPSDTGQQITVHHASFLDLLDDPTRSQAFHIGESQKKKLAHHILKALSSNVDHDHVAW
ncbi:hypothetical protein C8R47DRAFT_1230167 [Mycena vitilis]|nr:hypothetical protein C8R47DRAFT_1230167 [Mycena vitilis]